MVIRPSEHCQWRKHVLCSICGCSMRYWVWHTITVVSNIECKVCRIFQHQIQHDFSHRSKNKQSSSFCNGRYLLDNLFVVKYVQPVGLPIFKWSVPIWQNSTTGCTRYAKKNRALYIRYGRDSRFKSNKQSRQYVDRLTKSTNRARTIGGIVGLAVKSESI